MNVHGAKWLRRSRRLALYLRDRFACVYCGRDLSYADPRQITLDHVDDNRDHTNSNLVTCCVSCNIAKADTPITEWGNGRYVAKVAEAIARPVDTLTAVRIVNHAKRENTRLTHWRLAFRRAQKTVRVA